MAKSVKNLIRFRCSACKKVNYHAYKGKKIERKLEFRKYCRMCRKHTTHKEAKK